MRAWPRAVGCSSAARAHTFDARCAAPLHCCCCPLAYTIDAFSRHVLTATLFILGARGTSFFQHGSISWFYWRHLKSRRAQRRAREAATPYGLYSCREVTLELPRWPFRSDLRDLELTLVVAHVSWVGTIVGTAWYGHTGQ